MRLISEGQSPVCPLDKHSQVEKSKERRYAIQKYRALLKIATPISILHEKKVLLFPERAGTVGEHHVVRELGICGLHA